MHELYSTEFEKKMLFINPGEYIAVKEDVILNTILGSCIATCLYDPENHIIGMNHFLLVSKLIDPEKYYLQESGRFALNAMELLINEMMKLGAKKSNFKAKVFGGARVLPGEKNDYNDIPENNVKFILNFCKGENIQIVSQDLGGKNGRKILFFNDKDFSVLQQKLSRIDKKATKKIEINFWKRQRELLKEKY